MGKPTAPPFSETMRVYIWYSEASGALLVLAVPRFTRSDEGNSDAHPFLSFQEKSFVIAIWKASASLSEGNGKRNNSSARRGTHRYGAREGQHQCKRWDIEVETSSFKVLVYTPKTGCGKVPPPVNDRCCAQPQHHATCPRRRPMKRAGHTDTRVAHTNQARQRGWTTADALPKHRHGRITARCQARSCADSISPQPTLGKRTALPTVPQV